MTISRPLGTMLGGLQRDALAGRAGTPVIGQAPESEPQPSVRLEGEGLLGYLLHQDEWPRPAARTGPSQIPGFVPRVELNPPATEAGMGAQTLTTKEQRP
jgi:hypothetical protein